MTFCRLLLCFKRLCGKGLLFAVRLHINRNLRLENLVTSTMPWQKICQRCHCSINLLGPRGPRHLLHICIWDLLVFVELEVDWKITYTHATVVRMYVDLQLFSSFICMDGHDRALVPVIAISTFMISTAAELIQDQRKDTVPGCMYKSGIVAWTNIRR